jgi:hypothetical protein
MSVVTQYDGLEEKRSGAEIWHQISQILYYRSQDSFLEGGSKTLVNGAGDDDHIHKAGKERHQACQEKV